VRAASLEGHHVRLSAGVHHRVAHLQAALVDAVEDLQADGGAQRRAGVAPGVRTAGRGHEQGVDVDAGVPYAQLRPVRRAFRTDIVVHRAALLQWEVPPEVVVEPLLRFGDVAVRLRALRVRRPVPSLGDRCHGPLERVAVLVHERMCRDRSGLGHERLLWRGR
jgi:hypothetical protein